MPLKIVRNDITKMKVDAIVNAANSSLLGGGGVDGCIHRAAGRGLLRECETLGGCETGNAKLTKGYDLPAKYVIHAVGPVWRGGGHGERQLLASCYSTSLAIAKEHGCESIAFPLISSGVYGYPKDQALRVAVDEIGAFLSENEMEVYIVIFDKKSYQISGKLFADISSYIDDNYVAELEEKYPELSRHTGFYGAPPDRAAAFAGKKKAAKKRPKAVSAKKKPAPERTKGFDLDEEAGLKSMALPEADEALFGEAEAELLPAEAAFAPEAASLDEALKLIDESFSEMLLRKIDEKGMTDAQCYKKANIDRKLFSKIRSNPQYKPSKPTAVAFAVALELPLDETKELLMKAGFALSHSNKFDIIIEYFIQKGNYNVYEINEALFAFDQSLLGA